MAKGLAIKSALISVFSIFIFCSGADAAKRLGLDTSPRSFKENMKYAKELGVGILRVNLQWQAVEPKQGEFDWDMADRIVEAAKADQVEVLFLLTPISSWGTKEESQAHGIYHSGSAPKDMGQWVEFVKRLASRYQGSGVHYEIGNEVNGRAFWTGTLEEYLKLLKASYNVIKQADPEAKVLSSSMGCGIVRNFSSQAAQGQLRRRQDQWLLPILSTKAFDAVAVHDYYFPDEAAANGFTFRGYLEHTKELMKEAGVEGRPIWITECGYVSRPTVAGDRLDDGSAEKQAKQLTQAYTQAFESGVERIFWLLLRDRGEAYFGSMGLLDDKGNIRPAWDALKQFK